MITDHLKNLYAQWKNAILVIVIGFAFLGGILLGNKVLPKSEANSNPFEQAQKEIEAVNSAVLPNEGFKSKIVFGDSIVKLVQDGVIDIEKLEKIYAGRGGLTEEQKKLLTEPSSLPITISAENSNFILNLLWPLGIANKNSTLAESEAENPENLYNLASTGGWILGKKENGGDYYNKSEIIKLTAEQDALVKLLANNIFRPCCGNSTAFPDCNHGAAMLGLLQLGASQGLTEKELYDEALKFNSFWFPEEHVKMAMVFKLSENKAWKEIDPKLILGYDYSSGRGFRKNVADRLSELTGFFPTHGGGGGGGGCGV